jgi:uncharacterized protein (TIGR03437 family)
LWGKGWDPAFEANRGQFQEGVEYVARLNGGAAWMRADGLRLSETVGIRWDGGAVRTIEAARTIERKAHYYWGPEERGWIRDVPHAAELRQREVYPGIDVRYYFRDGDLEWDWEAAPESDVNRIAMRIEGATWRLLPDGSLEAQSEGRRWLLRRPEASQDGRPVEVSYQVEGARVRLRTGAYDRTKPLTIDPRLQFVGYYGAAGPDQIGYLATDANRAIYITGSTTNDGLPWPPNRRPTEESIFVVRLDPLGRSPQWLAYLGAGVGRHLAVSPLGIYVAGTTTDARTVPVSASSYNAPNRGQRDAFVARLRDTGALVFAAVVGGGGNDDGAQVAVDAAGNVFLCGTTRSTNFPITPNALRVVFIGGGSDAFVTRLTPEGGALTFSTYLGGTGVDEARAMVLDENSSVYIAGETESDDLPTTPGVIQGTRRPAQTTPLGNFDAFLMRVTPLGNLVLAATYLGGGRFDVARALTRDSEGNLYVGGATQSSDFPLTFGTVQERIDNDRVRMFVSKVNREMTRLIASTGLGGQNDLAEVVTDLKLDAQQNLIVGGAANFESFPINLGDTPGPGPWGVAFYLRGDLRQVADALPVASQSVVNAVAFTAGAPAAAGTGEVEVLFGGVTRAAVPLRFGEQVVGGFAGDTDGVYGRVALTRPTVPPGIVATVRADAIPPATTLFQYSPFTLTYEVSNGFGNPITSLLIRNDRALTPVVPAGTATLTSTGPGEYTFAVSADIQCSFGIAVGNSFQCSLRPGRTIPVDGRVTFAVRVIEVQPGRFTLQCNTEARSSTAQTFSAAPTVVYETGLTAAVPDRPVVNAVDFRGRAPAPGGLSTIFGRFRLDVSQLPITVADQVFPYSEAGVTVLVNNTMVPVLFANSEQINFYLPPGFLLGQANVVVFVNGVPSLPFRQEIRRADPYIFTRSGEVCACQNADGNINNEFTPAVAGGLIVAYFTGGGASMPDVPHNRLAPGSPLPVLRLGSRAWINGVETRIEYIGYTPGSVGLQQANIAIPAGLSAGSHPLEIEVDGRRSNAAVIFVRRP